MNYAGDSKKRVLRSSSILESCSNRMAAIEVQEYVPVVGTDSIERLVPAKYAEEWKCASPSQQELITRQIFIDSLNEEEKAIFYELSDALAFHQDLIVKSYLNMDYF